MSDQIKIEGLEIMTHVGVPDEERATPQKVEVSIFLTLELQNAGKTDKIDETIDYYQVQQQTIALAEEKPRKLIETLAEDIATMVLLKFRPEKVKVEVKKFILKNTRSVAVTIKRSCKA